MSITIHCAFLPHTDADAALAFYRDQRLESSGADVVQEPIEQDYGVRDCAFRHPSGNLIRINELR